MSRNSLFSGAASSSSVNVSFPSKIEVTEKKAPTDQSIEILHEMEDKALDSVIAKVSGCDNNVVIWEAYFTEVASLSFERAGILVIRTRINGKEYMRKVRVRDKIMNQIHKAVELHESRALHMIDLNGDLQRFILFELAVVLAHCIVDGNGGDFKAVQDLIERMSAVGVSEFTIAKMEDELNK